MKLYFASLDWGRRNTAASKAPKDVETILIKMGGVKLPVKTVYSHGFISRYRLDYPYKKISVCRSWKKIYNDIEPESAVVIQHPVQMAREVIRYVKKLQSDKGCRIILLIHDLERLRNGVYKGSYRAGRSNFNDRVFLNCCDKIICHNYRMKNYLTETGIPEEKIVELGIFDYICEDNRRKCEFNRTVAIAGNMSGYKSGYIYEFANSVTKIGVELFGVNFDETREIGNAIYKGNFTPEELVRNIRASFGIVWDGPVMDGCTGNTGEYLRYNNPHKLSLYLASNMPVIVWKESAAAEFVINNGVGFAVDSLDEAENILIKMSYEEYEKYFNNACIVGDRLRNGEYTRNAVMKCMN